MNKPSTGSPRRHTTDMKESMALTVEDPACIQVVGLGQACVDYLGRVPFFPEEDQKVELTELRTKCGGPASSALVALAAFGVRTSFLGSVSDDPFGREIRRNLLSKRVDLRGLKVTPGFTSQFAFIAVSRRDGRRTIFWHRGSVPHLLAEDVDMSSFPGCKILHMDGLMVEACAEAARQAHGRGITVVMDAGTMREGSRELVSLVDVLIASRNFADPLVGPNAPVEKALEALKGLGPAQVIITMGREGSVGLGPDGPIFQSVFPVDAVDTTGAGDVYHGGYIYGMLQGWDMARCMRFAAAAAAVKCRDFGAQTDSLTLDAVLDLLGG